jgi:hypothetical protein
MRSAVGQGFPGRAEVGLLGVYRAAAVKPLTSQCLIPFVVPIDRTAINAYS